jgi:hypothetical protein
MQVSISGAPIAALVILVMAAASCGAFRQAASDALRESTCTDAREAATDALQKISILHTRMVRNSIDTAVTVFRAGRAKEAVRSLDFALEVLDLTRRRLMKVDERQNVRNLVGRLRRCMETSVSPAPATLTVRTYEQDDRMADGRGGPARPGAIVRVDGMPVGRTAAGGIFSGTVPSGSVRVTAEIPPSESGEETISLGPGGAGEVSIRLHDSKEVTEETPLMVAEADGGILSGASPTLTLRFITADGAVRLQRLEQVDLIDTDGNLLQDLTSMFSLADRAIVAVDAAKVIRIMQAPSANTVVVRVQATDQDSIHAADVDFRIQ